MSSTTAKNPVIATTALTKAFDGHIAVDHVDLEVRPGEIFGLIGPNGAGKSTLVKMLTTLLPPSGGSSKFGLGVDCAVLLAICAVLIVIPALMYPRLTT